MLKSWNEMRIRSVMISGSVSAPSGTSYYGKTTSGSGTAELDKISRASVISSAAAVTLGNICSIQWTPASELYRFKLEFTIGDWSYTTEAIHPNTTSAYTYTGYTIPLDVAMEITSGKTGMMLVALHTYSDPDATVPVGGVSFKTFNVTVPNNSLTQPSVTMTLSPESSLPDAFAGLYVQGVTKVKAVLSAEGKYGTRIAVCGVRIAGKTFTGSSITSDYLEDYRNVDVYGYATDYRGYFRSVSETIEVIPYPVMILQFSKAKWNKMMSQGKTLGEILFENDTKKLNALDIEQNKKSRVTAAQFASYEAIATTLRSPQLTTKVTQTTPEVKDESVETLMDVGIAVDSETDAGAIFSVRDVLDDTDRKKVAKALMDRFEVTEKEAMDWLKAETSLASLILNPKYSMFLDYEADPNEVAIKQNSDYPQGTVDFSNICKKRREFTQVMNRVLRNFPNHVFAATDLAKIRTIMGEEGMTLPCGICYVEDRRQLDTIVAQDFINGLKLYREGSKTRPDGKPFNANQLKGLQLTDGDTYVPTIYELVSLEGRNSLKAKNPNMEAAWVKYNNARGMQSVRLLTNEAEYKRQILKYNKKTVQSKNDHGGLRIYSFSDAEMFHLIDIIQVITDSAAVGLTLQGYTKVNEYAKAVKDTGEKLNRSLIPLGDLGYHVENGKVVLDYDTVEGIDINSKDFFDNKDNPDVGNITIGINDIQIRAAMVSDFVDQIIPFHTGQSEEVLGEKGIAAWKNYKDFQTEKDIATGKTSAHQINIYTEVFQAAEKEGKPIQNKRQFVEKFLEVCKENGLQPRFSDFLNTDAQGNYIYTEGYHKFLVDFKTFAQTEIGEYLPQKPVKPIFDNAYITGLLKDYVKEQQVKDAEVAKQMPRVIERVTNEIIKADEEIEQFSDRDSDGNELSKEQRAYFAQSKVRDDQGRLIPMYHGTDSPDFTVFDPKYSDDKTSLFFTSAPEVADTYTQLNGRDVDPYNLITKDSSAEQFNKAQERVGGGLRVVKITPEWIQEMKGVAEKKTAKLIGIANKYADLLEANNDFELFDTEIERMREIAGKGDKILRPKDILAIKKAMLSAKSHTFMLGDSAARSEINRMNSDNYKLFTELSAYATAAFAKGDALGQYTYTETSSANPFVLFGSFNDGSGMLEYGTEQDMVAKAFARSKWANETNMGNRYKVYLNITNPLIVDAQGKNWNELPEGTTRDYARKAKAEGNDGVIFRNIVDTLTEAFNGVRAGEDVWAKDVVEARKYYLDKAKKYGYDSWDFKKKYRFMSDSDLDFELTLEQILSLYAYSKREQAHDHLRLGGFVFDSNIETYKEKGSKILKYKVNTADAHQITAEILTDIIGKLSKEQMAFVDEMQDYLSTVMGAKGNEITMKMYGVKLFKEKFYFPLKSAKQFMFEQNEVSGEVKIKNSGFTNKTVAKANNPVILSNFMDVWSNHVNDMSMYHAFVLPLEDFNRIFNYNSPKKEGQPSVSVKGTIQSAYTPAAVNYVKQLITDLNGGARTDSTTGFINKMMGLFKKGSVFASLSVVVQQPSAIARAAALLDAKYFIGPKVNHKRHKALWDEVKQYAPVAIIKEMGYFDTNMGKSTQDFILGKEYSGFGEKMKALVTDSGFRDEILSKAPALADEIAWCSIWEAVKRETKAKHPGLDVKSEPFLMLAGSRFTEVITKTQVYDSVLSRSANMRSKDTGMKMATAFMAEPTTSINMVADALLQGKRGNRKYCRAAIGAVVASQILNSILVSFVYAGRDDDEDETYWEKYIGTLTGEILDSLNPAEYIPFIKDIMSIVQGYDVERSDMAVISDLWNAWLNLKKDNVSVYRKVEGFAGSIAQIFGLPVKNIMRDARGIYQIVMSFMSGQQTTKAGIGYAVKANIPAWLGGGETSNQQQLYEAILSGDKAQIARVEGRFEDQSSINSAIRKALRENDSRIRAAAEAKVIGDLDEYMRLAREIIAEKHFSQDNVVAAINAEINAMSKEENTSSTTQKASGMFNADDFAVAIAQGDSAMANAVKSDIIKTAQKNGKTAEEAEKSFISAAASACKELFLEGELSERQTINALRTYCGRTEDEAVADVQYWAFKQDYPDVYADDAWFDKYYEEVADSGIGINVYMEYRNQVKDITGEGKKERRMAIINSMPITSAQKDALYFAEGWAESKLHEAPWH